MHEFKAANYIHTPALLLTSVGHFSAEVFLFSLSSLHSFLSASLPVQFYVVPSFLPLLFFSLLSL